MQGRPDQSAAQELNRPEKASPTLYTIGHGKRTIDELIAALRTAGVRRLVDIRRFPHSRTNPQFNREALAQALPKAGINYVHEERLGGRRKGLGAESPNGAWTHPAFRAYADCMMEESFWSALDELLADARETTGVMCSETLWWRCHRRLVADAAVARGFRVVHIMGPSAMSEHTVTAPGRIVGDRVVYTAAEPS